VLGKARLRIVIRVGWISNLERTSSTYPRIDALRHGASLTLEPKNLLRAVDADSRTGKVDKNTDCRWETGARVGDGSRVVSHECAQLVGSKSTIVFEAKCSSISIS
jgi:hypothetical protein